jgi:hypothetical protein
MTRKWPKRGCRRAAIARCEQAADWERSPEGKADLAFWDQLAIEACGTMDEDEA